MSAFVAQAFCIFFLITVSMCQAEQVTVHLNHGTIQGEEDVDENENKYFAFRGIPYAEAPANHLRFKAPVPKLPWDGILNTTRDGPACPQLFYTGKYIGEEDNCLTLNVYTPQLPATNNDVKLDVVFHIHGGGFAAGDGGETLYGSKRFMSQEKNLILVSVTYRVGSIGFLSTMDTSSPGNYGLLDQLEALRWVRNNIDRFGGDPTKVTLFGESAGGASVLYHVLSPLSKGLFHRAIAMSGTPLDPWGHQHEPLHWAKKLAAEAGCPTTNTTIAIVNCLKTKSMENIIASEPTSDPAIKVSGPVRYIFSPTVDHYFLPDTPYDIIKNKQYNDVPMILGTTKDEGNCWYRFDDPRPGGSFTDEEITNLLKTIFNGATNVDKAIQLVKERYFASLKSEEVHDSYSKVVTDGFFRINIYQTAKMMAERGSTLYFYSYDHEGNEGFKKMLNISDDVNIGVCHGVDLSNFFLNQFLGDEPQKGKDLEIQQQMQKLFFSFVLNGNPNSDDLKIKWPSVEPNKMPMYHIDTNNSVSIYEASKDENYQFWVEDISKIFGIHQHSPRSESSKEEL